MSVDRTGSCLLRNIDTAHQVLEEARRLAEPLQRAAMMVRDALLAGRKVLCCGNGGSAADAGHFAAEIAGRYVLDRPGFPAIDLTSPTMLTTALSNDYPAAEVFARQVQALGQPGDVLVAFTTSGNSENVRLALGMAKQRRLRTVAFLGKGGGKCKDLADVELIVPSDTTARIQEVHQLLYHTLCEVLDPVLAQAAAPTKVSVTKP